MRLRLQQRLSGFWEAGRSQRGASLVQFALWFLAGGAVSTAGRWIDSIPWTPGWFLASGQVDVFGAWDDARAW